MAVKYLLDTNTVSDALKGRAAQVTQRLANIRRDDVAISVITAMEMRFGLAKNPTAKIKAVVERFLEVIPIDFFPENMPEIYGKVRAHLEKRGSPIGPLDTIIAAHALAIKATLVSRNMREFMRVPNLRCETWR